MLLPLRSGRARLHSLSWESDRCRPTRAAPVPRYPVELEQSNVRILRSAAVCCGAAACLLQLSPPLQPVACAARVACLQRDCLAPASRSLGPQSSSFTERDRGHTRRQLAASCTVGRVRCTDQRRPRGQVDHSCQAERAWQRWLTCGRQQAPGGELLFHAALPAVIALCAIPCYYSRAGRRVIARISK